MKRIISVAVSLGMVMLWAVTVAHAQSPPGVVNPGATSPSTTDSRAANSALPARKVFRPIVTALASNPRLRQLAAAGDRHVIDVQNLDSGERAFLLRGHRDWVRALAYSPDGRTLISGGNDRRLLSWNAQTGRLQAELLATKNAITRLAFDASGRWLAVTGFFDSVHLLDMTNGDRFQLTCPCADMRAIQFSSDGKKLAAAGRNGVIRVWSIPDRQQIAERRVHRQRTRDLAFSADNKKIYSVGEDRRIHVWNLQQDQQSYDIEVPRCKLFSLVRYGTGRIAVGGSDNSIRLLDVATKQEVGRSIDHNGTVARLITAGDLLVSSGFDAEVRSVTIRSLERVPSNRAKSPEVGILSSTTSTGVTPKQTAQQAAKPVVTSMPIRTSGNVAPSILSAPPSGVTPSTATPLTPNTQRSRYEMPPLPAKAAEKSNSGSGSHPIFGNRTKQPPAATSAGSAVRPPQSNLPPQK